MGIHTLWVLACFERMAGTTGLEPATSAVTGQRSSRLNYVPATYVEYIQNDSTLVGDVRFERTTFPV